MFSKFSQNLKFKFTERKNEDPVKFVLIFIGKFTLIEIGNLAINFLALCPEKVLSISNEKIRKFHMSINFLFQVKSV